MVGMLLEHTVGNLDPRRIVKAVPGGLEIPQLRDRLVKIITDYRTETSLRHGCNDILKADIVNLLVKYYKEARRGIYFSYEEEEARAKDNRRVEPPSGRALNLKNMEVKSKTRAGGRCCICFDPITIQSVSVVAFFCCHAYHMTCYSDASNTFRDDKGNPRDEESDDYDEADDESDENQSNASQLRCILCTNAS